MTFSTSKLTHSSSTVTIAIIWILSMLYYSIPCTVSESLIFLIHWYCLIKLWPAFISPVNVSRFTYVMLITLVHNAYDFFKFMWYLCLFTSETEFFLIDIVAVLHSLNWIVLIEVLTAIALLFLYSSFSGTIQILYHLAFSAKIKHKLFAMWVVWNVKLKNALIFKCSDQWRIKS